MSDGRALSWIEIGLHNAACASTGDRAWCSVRTEASLFWLALNCALYNTPAALLWWWQLTRARFDQLRLALHHAGARLDQLAVNIGRELRIIRVHILSDANSAALKNGETCGRSGQLCCNQFDRHEIRALRLLTGGSGAAHPLLHQIQPSHDASAGPRTTRLTMNRSG